MSSEIFNMYSRKFEYIVYRYQVAKRLVKSYGNVRIFNAEACHRPKGHENDPRLADRNRLSNPFFFAFEKVLEYLCNTGGRSAVYINTGKGKALCTFTKLQNVVDGSVKKAHALMDKLGLPQFPPENLKRVQDFDMKTPKQGLMTINEHFWGPDPEAAQIDFMKQFNTVAKVKCAVQMGKEVCLEVLAGVINHMAPAGECP